MGCGDPAWQGWVLNEEESLPLVEYAYNKGIRTWDTLPKRLPIRPRIRPVVPRAFEPVAKPTDQRAMQQGAPSITSPTTPQQALDQTVLDEVQASENPEAQTPKDAEAQADAGGILGNSGVSLIPWSPIARGALARPWDSRSTSREDADVGLNILVRARESESDKAIIDRVEELAGKKGISMAQAAIAWSPSHPSEHLIVGLNTRGRIDEAVASVHIELMPEEIQP
ncbi:unnamed protein product [Penicillium salamii]|uniref:NADP-dependent oxidoreductase domain-containing protein n=1 Tax=Penicillium salamii TaxID=1612424 RepID=A0A9W4IM48_9EURO|nr:unnamed protein product [Penicillium salamii]CAG8024844.1 unnamed protein product [Penicillium salamii]CAG8083197.1 unnamed protein product [Penicillium salamii]CAG8117708.1 unnamed protein product [Penicillium salamii]CAG8184311.1 unnamed protein product [Penicillium salamii]